MKMITEQMMRDAIEIFKDSHPQFPIRGRGFKRVDVGLVEDWMFKLPASNHYSLVSVREPINRFGKLGCPKHLMISFEFEQYFS